jgi:hypothetical protein
MKKLLVMSVCLGATATLLAGDGKVNFNNKVTLDNINARVTDMDGNPVSGADYSAQLLWGLASDSLAPIGVPVAFYSDRDTKYGYINGGDVVVADGAGVAGFVAMVAWDHNAGADYASAMAAGGQTGMSNVIPLTLGGDPGTGDPPIATPNLVGLEAFQLTAEIIPEPSTFALGLIGIGALMLRRRK